MNQFASHLLSRHLEPDKSLKPRVRGRFEPVGYAPNLFTADDYREASAEDAVRQQVANQGVQPDLPFDEKTFYPGSSGKQATATKQSTEAEGASEETAANYHNPFRSPHSSFAEKRSNQPDMPERIPAAHIADAGFHPAGIVPPTHEPKRQSQAAENPYVKTNRENQTANPFTGKDFAERHVATTQAGSSAEAVQPVLKKNNAIFSESDPDGTTGLLRSQPPSRNVSPSPLQHPGGTAQPVIKVTIGRIDVRAVVQAASPPPRGAAAAKPKLSLEEYLKQRNNKMT